MKPKSPNARNRLTKEDRLRLNGAVFTHLRNVEFMRIPQDTSDAALTALFAAPPSEFWRAISELESSREVRRTADGIYYQPPEERW
jgi:hypothetical protein